MMMVKIKAIKSWLALLAFVVFALFYFSTLLNARLFNTKTPDETSAPLEQLSNSTPSPSSPVDASWFTPTPGAVDNKGASLPTKKYVKVERVIDGDTIEVEGGVRVRYIGMDSPEKGECFSTASTAKNSSIVFGKQVRLETDVERLDKYGRLLAYVFVEDVFVNEVMVREGFATVLTIPPNVKYSDRLLSAQKRAQVEGLGIWANEPCPEMRTSDGDRDSQVEGARIGCEIKGNISKSGEKIYHVPGQRYYEKTKITEEKGERWFCSEEEAKAAGWRKAKI